MHGQLVCGVVLVLALAAVVPAARGELALGDSIENGQLNSQAAKEQAVAKLSNGPKQESWWQLGEIHWNESALEQFFAGRQNMSPDQYLVNSLKQSATAVYNMSKYITGVGRIEACLWTLMFQCIDPACSQGMVPLVVVPGSSAHEYVYAPLLLPVTASLLVEAIPSSTALLPDASPVVISKATQFRSQENDSALSLTINVRHNLSSCPSGAAALNCRSSLLDSAFGLLPESFCVEFMREDKQAFRLLVSEASPVLLNGSDPSADGLDDFLSSFLFVNVSSTWQKRPIEACYEEPLVLAHHVDGLSDKYTNTEEGVSEWIVMGCYNESCMYFDHGNVSCGASLSDLGNIDPSGLDVPSVVHAVFKLCFPNGPDHFYAPDQPRKCSLDLPNQFPACKYQDHIVDEGTLVICHLSKHRVCSVTINSVYEANHFQSLFSPLANWSVTEDRFRNTTSLSTDQREQPLVPCIPSLPDVNMPAETKSWGHVLLVWESPYGNNVGDSHETGQASQAILIRATAYLRSYIAEHNVAFTTAKGPATDLYTFVALIVSTAISVIPAVPWPFTNYLLKQISKRCPYYLCSSKSHLLCQRRAAKMSLHAICNTILSLVFFLPVLSMAINELQRGQPFYTWDLGSSDLDVALDSELNSDTQKLRVVYLFSATSKYDSQFFIAITATVSLTCFIVVICTIRRCMQIFSRYDLLESMEKCLIELSMDLQPVPAQRNEPPIAELVQRAFKAIEMSDSKYHCLIRKVKVAP